MSTLAIPMQHPHERTSTATKSQQEELQQIEADLQEEKLYSLRSRLDNLMGSLAQPNNAISIEPTLSTQPQDHPQKQGKERDPRGLLLPGRVWVVDPCKLNLFIFSRFTTNTSKSDTDNSSFLFTTDGDQGQYKGDVDDQNLPDGTGDMIYVDGRKYHGGWKHGHWHGSAKCRWPNGDIFKGTFDMCERHGHGSYQWSDGRSFTGDFFKDKRHGNGEFRWPDGSTYVGEFKQGHRDGYGNYRFPDGSVYEGGWCNSQMHGQGECQWADKRVYSGEWQNGKAHGLGKETRPDGSVRHDGLWEEDRPIRDVPAADISSATITTITSTAETTMDVSVSVEELEEAAIDDSLLDAVVGV